MPYIFNSGHQILYWNGFSLTHKVSDFKSEFLLENHLIQFEFAYQIETIS